MLPDQARMVLSGDPAKDKWLVQERHDRIPVFRGHGFDSVSTVASTTTSATFVAPANLDTNEFTFIKDESWTDVKLHIAVSCWTTGVDTTVAFGVNLGGTDYEITQFFVNNINEHHTVTGWKYLSDFGGPLRAGRYTGYLVWRRVAGVGTLTINNTDNCFVEVTEALPPRI